MPRNNLISKESLIRFRKNSKLRRRKKSRLKLPKKLKKCKKKPSRKQS